MITALAGGVGAARMLRGMAQVVPPSDITAIVNTGDDAIIHGLHVSPDLDTVTYTLAGAANDETGWGLAGETWTTMEALRRLGGETWFSLGDHDLATHLYRTDRLTDGAPLSEVTGELARAWGVAVRILPVTDDPLHTRVQLRDGREVAFQEYFVRLRHEVPVSSIRFDGAATARPAPGVIDALEHASGIVVCPSNPVVSIDPLLAVPGVVDVLQTRRDRIVGISPIVGGAALKGPADRLLRELGGESSATGVARWYASWLGTLVIDEADLALAPAVEAEGVRCLVAPTVMSTPAKAAALARVVLDALG
ncbi:MAG: 2-phospho-L-lactate transferase [Actinomycetota bacterium]|nr:2-phospho-L-lactate transferase [Actinomycetota bacterium]MDA8343256.1 2-phospho-L-lactate transferase [Actinomycetota bacterium]